MYMPTILALRGDLIYVASISPIYIPILIPVTNFVLTLIGVLATCFRLWRRKTTTHIWWDDIWAALTMILGIIFMTSFELFLQNQSLFPGIKDFLLTCIQSVLPSLILLSIRKIHTATPFHVLISILFIVIRISNGRMRYILKWIAAIFVLTWVILTAQLLWTCEGKNADWGPGHLICVMPLRVAIVQLTTDTLSDVILIVAPLRLVWNINLNHACWLIVDGGGLSEALAAVIQNSVSLIVCNFSVIIAFIFQIAAEDARSSYHVEAGSLSLRCKVPSGVPSGTGVRIERTEVITLDSLGSLHGNTTKVGQPFDTDSKDFLTEKDCT
ncbi:uncharacterized protein LACBIDRAFT_328161 [Laccaria bicolor S238N-H82]|uniref:Predicted protein n=1 Tax=Laccaria bicolor (strain S238N-H82 / ATCC MYA-4686) TaxID=486041 RepID=B0DDX8_LACBS|nr:uncharacterized protein LACBIDRAFT_328161 [Laccaria bicolor S238N-H82]EDR07296.1 predicted protein [Laccaria bicolor S238N-H82]|eukprot:XP_001882227.1 predicted protein [Laccaria bicolor S238N-H82]